MKELRERIVKLERTCHHQQKVIWSLGFIALVVMGFGFTKGPVEELVLRQLSIIDGDGNVRIVLSAGFEEDEQAASMMHFDSDENRRLWIGTDEAGVNSTYYDENETIRVTQSVSEEGAAAASCWDDEGVIRAEIGMFFEDETPRLVLDKGVAVGLSRMLFYDDDEDLRIAIDANDPEGDAGAHFIDKDGVTRIWMGSHSEGGPSRLALIDEFGELRWTTYTDDEGDCVTQMWDAKGIERISSIVFADGKSFLCFSDDEEISRIVLAAVEDHVSVRVDGQEIAGNSIPADMPESETSLPTKVVEECQHE